MPYGAMYLICPTHMLYPCFHGIKISSRNFVKGTPMEHLSEICLKKHSFVSEEKMTP